MYRNYKIRAPYFEIGPKCFMWGERMLKLAKKIDEIAGKYDLDVIVTPQYVDIRLLAENTENIHVYAQHMDALRPGRGLGSVLPEAVKAAGAVGVMLNHAEKKLTLDEIRATIERADEVGLATIVCADSVEEIRQVALLSPKDSTLKGGTVTESNGNFRLEVPYGRYLLRITFVGYEPQYYKNTVTLSTDVADKILMDAVTEAGYTPKACTAG